MIRPGGPQGKEGTTVKVGANGQQSGGGRRGSSTLDGRDNVGDTTSLASPLLSLSLSSSSAIAEEHVAGGVPLSTDSDLDAVPADKEYVVDVDNYRAMVATVIATLDTMGGDDAREVIVLALSSSTRHTCISILLVIHKKI